MSFWGCANYSNLSRHSGLSEQPYRRRFGGKPGFIEFNRIGNSEMFLPSALKIAVLDASFASKSGGNIYGLGKFYNGKQGKAKTGLDITAPKPEALLAALP